MMRRGFWMLVGFGLILALLPGHTLTAQGSLQCSTRKLVSAPYPGFVGPDYANVAFTSAAAIYVTSGSDPAQSSLWAQPLDGGSPRRLNDGLPGGLAYGYEVSPDGTQVVFAQRLTGSDPFRLYTVPVDGSQTPVLLPNRDPRFDRSRVDSGFFRFTPDGARLVVLYRDEISQGIASVDLARNELKILDNGTVILGPFVFLDVTDQWVAYASARSLDSPESQVLYTVPVDGSRLLVPLDRFEIDPRAAALAGDQVVYQRSGTGEIYAVPLDGSAPPRRLENAPSPWRPPDYKYNLFYAVPGDPFVVYLAPDERGPAHRVVRLNVETGQVITLGPPVNRLSWVPWRHPAPLGAASIPTIFGGRLVVYVSQNIGSRWVTYLAPLDGSALPVALEQAGSPLELSTIHVSPSQDRILFESPFSLKLLWLDHEILTPVDLPYGWIMDARFLSNERIAYSVHTGTTESVYILDCR